MVVYNLNESPKCFFCLYHTHCNDKNRHTAFIQLLTNSCWDAEITAEKVPGCDD